MREASKEELLETIEELKSENDVLRLENDELKKEKKLLRLNLCTVLPNKDYQNILSAIDRSLKVNSSEGVDDGTN